MGGDDAQGVPFWSYPGEELLEKLLQVRRFPGVKHAGYCACTHCHRINPLVLLLYPDIGQKKG
jgi:hypothetical protein